MMSRMHLLLQIAAILTSRVDHLLQPVDQVIRVVAFVLMEAVVIDREPQVLHTAHILVTREGPSSILEDPMDRVAQVRRTVLTPVIREGLPSILVDLTDREGLLLMMAPVNPTVRVDLPHTVVLMLMARIHFPWEAVKLKIMILPCQLVTARVSGVFIPQEAASQVDMGHLLKVVAMPVDRTHLHLEAASMVGRVHLPQEAASLVDRVDVIVLGEVLADPLL